MLTLAVSPIRAAIAAIESKPSRTLRRAPPGAAPPDPERTRLVGQIITVNPTATAAFLDRFHTRDLELYLSHLEQAQSPRGGAARWVRPEGARGILRRDART